MVKYGRNEARAVSTIAIDRAQKHLLVTHRAGGGGGPFSRMTKFTRLELRKSPALRRQLAEEAGNFETSPVDARVYQARAEERRMTAVPGKKAGKFPSLEIHAKQVIPGKMY